MDQAEKGGAPLDLHDDTNRRAIESALPEYLVSRRWFGGKARKLRAVRIVDSVDAGHGETHRVQIAIAEILYDDGDTQQYVLPLRLDLVTSPESDNSATGGKITQWQVEVGGAKRTLVASDATHDPDFASGLLNAVARNSRWTGDRGDIVAWSTPELSSLARADEALEPSVMGAEQSNTSIRYGKALILKLFRRLEEGTSPELEIGRTLQAARFAQTPPLGGAIEYAQPGREPLTLAVLQGFVPNIGDAWGYTIASLEGYYERVLEGTPDVALAGTPGADLLDLAAHSPPDGFAALAGGYLDSAALLGRTTALMHLALARADAGPAFDPEPLDLEHREQMYAAMRLQTEQAFGLLRSNLTSIPPDAVYEAEAVLRRGDDIANRFAPLLSSGPGGLRTRVHGDYHLGQVLYTGSEFIIIDFEGEPARSLAERRRKHSPLKDVAGMVRSFHYAAYAGLFNHGRKYGRTVAGLHDAERWADAWYAFTSAAFLREYMVTLEGSNLLPGGRDAVRTLLSVYLLEKAVYELVYELNNRPTWVAIPLKGISALLS